MKQWIAAAAMLAAAITAQAQMVAGEVQKIDEQAGRVTLKHGPIRQLDMPAMTMTYRVADRAALARLQPGDPVRFSAAKVGGQYTITAIERAR